MITIDVFAGETTVGQLKRLFHERLRATFSEPFNVVQGSKLNPVGERGVVIADPAYEPEMWAHIEKLAAQGIPLIVFALDTDDLEYAENLRIRHVSRRQPELLLPSLRQLITDLQDDD
jgi:hypothetical protein